MTTAPRYNVQDFILKREIHTNSLYDSLTFFEHYKLIHVHNNHIHSIRKSLREENITFSTVFFLLELSLETDNKSNCFVVVRCARRMILFSMWAHQRFSLIRSVFLSSGFETHLCSRRCFVCASLCASNAQIIYNIYVYIFVDI